MPPMECEIAFNSVNFILIVFHSATFPNVMFHDGGSPNVVAIVEGLECPLALPVTIRDRTLLAQSLFHDSLLN